MKKLIIISRYSVLILRNRAATFYKQHPWLFILGSTAIFSAFVYLTIATFNQFKELTAYSTTTSPIVTRTFALYSTFYILFCHIVFLIIEKSESTWRNLFATPTKRWELWIGFNAPIIGFLWGLLALLFTATPIIFQPTPAPSFLLTLFRYLVVYTFVSLQLGLMLLMWFLGVSLASSAERTISQCGQILKFSMPMGLAFFNSYLVYSVPDLIIHPAFLASGVLFQTDVYRQLLYATALFLELVIVTALLVLVLSHLKFDTEATLANTDFIGKFRLNHHALNFIWLDIKRYLRDKSQLILLAFSFSIIYLVVLGVYNMIDIKELSNILIFISIPYISITLALFSTSRDVNFDWLYKSSPFSEFRYLWLKQVTATLFAFLIGFMFVVAVTIYNKSIGVFDFISLVPRIAGIVSIAIAIGYFIPVKTGDSIGEIGLILAFTIIASASQYLLDNIPAWINQPILENFNVLWFVPFATLPLICTALKKYYMQDNPS